MTLMNESFMMFKKETFYRNTFEKRLRCVPSHYQTNLMLVKIYLHFGIQRRNEISFNEMAKLVLNLDHHLWHHP